MSTEIKVAQRMVSDFKTFSPSDKVDKAITDLTASGAKYCVVMTLEGEPLALATPEQLQVASDMDTSLHDILDKLPIAVVIEQGQTMDDVVTSLSSVLIGARDIPGVAVFHNGMVTGVVPRRAIAEHASFGIKTRGTGTIEGDPLSGPRRYVCPQGDHERSVTFYDRTNPPRCPTHHVILVRKV
ncbi:MAG TPA: hypothetical protein VD861_13980 [Pyrinomonadaceae bacterium]|nr:hypothetical protein [Pyrinomonadaceae bacterium]